MAAGFDLLINSHSIRTVEAFYQACRFPHLPDLQAIILNQRSPMAAKMKGKPFRNESRSDWNQIKVRVMRWSLHVKLLQHRSKFGNLLMSTASKPIVEDSRRDDFWGAIAKSDETLVGANVLGRLLVELREDFRSEPSQFLEQFPPLKVPEFYLLNEPITAAGPAKESASEFLSSEVNTPGDKPIQNSFFN